MVSSHERNVGGEMLKAKCKKVRHRESTFVRIVKCNTMYELSLLSYKLMCCFGSTSLLTTIVS